MPVRLAAPASLLAIDGVRLGVAKAHIKKPDRRDLVLMELAPGATCAATFTTNAFCAAPVVLARTHSKQTSPRYLLINTGYANAGTGERGLADAQRCCEAVAMRGGCKAEEVLPFSTGVIGEYLPVDRVVNGLDAVFGQLAADGWVEAAHGIMTTDTVAKGISRQVEIDGKVVTVTGIAKGSGMIAPNMATMLAFIATDAGVEQELLQSMLSRAVEESFNRIIVDGDTSTNDACVLAATGKSAVMIRDEASVACQKFAQALAGVCRDLAQAIVRDGEGVTKFVTLQINGARDLDECAKVGQAIGTSPLVKTALFASDPNWGRILAAVGRAGLEALDVDRIAIYLDDVCIVDRGMRAAAYTEAAGQAVMSKDEILIRVELNRAEVSAHYWTCDFSYDYVRINAEYRT